MGDAMAYFNGEYVPEDEVKISMRDRGFVTGDAAFDIARTYNHQPFKWREHIGRWFQSLRYIQLDIGLTADEVYDITLEVFRRNERHFGSNADCAVVWRATPGEERFKVPVEPTVLIHCASLQFQRVARQYIEGAHIVVASTRAVPPQCVDPKAKLHGRSHYVLAELEANSVEPGAYPLMLDLNGCLTECARQNIFLVREGKLLTPTRRDILEGVSRATTLELAQGLGIETQETDLFIYDVKNADEIFLTATSFAMLPVAKVNNKSLGRPVPGPVTKQLLSAWNELVGVDIVQQALHHAEAQGSGP